MSEEVKRLIPKPEVLRKLYVKSGNICAFPGCLHPIVNVEGVLVAQLCHIEAANEGGQRFNPKQTNEERRQYENLLLLCHRHHKETDDVVKYPVEKMREIKRNHESKFEKVLDSLANDIYDVALAYQATTPSSLDALIKDGLITKDEEEVYKSELLELVGLLNKISPVTRKIFLLVVKRADEYSLDFSLNEFKHIVKLDFEETYNHISILESYGLLYDDECDDFSERKLHIRPLIEESPYPFVMFLKEYCMNKSIDLSSLLVDLNFSLLDSEL